MKANEDKYVLLSINSTNKGVFVSRYSTNTK